MDCLIHIGTALLLTQRAPSRLFLAYMWRRAKKGKDITFDRRNRSPLHHQTPLTAALVVLLSKLH